MDHDEREPEPPAAEPSGIPPAEATDSDDHSEDECHK